MQANNHNTTHKQNQGHTIISTDAGKAFIKIQHPFMMRALKKLGTEGMYLNIMKLHMTNL
jgi:hypothetical protein